MKISAVAARLTLRIEDLCHHLFPGGKRVANEFRIGDITGGPGDSLAINLTHPKCGLWVDRANPSSHGDALQLIQLSQNLPDAIAAADWARRWLGIPAWTPGEDANAPKEWDPLKEARFSVDDEWKLPVAAWAYRDAQGALIAWVCRYIKANGSKDVIPWRRTTAPVKNRAGKEIPVGTWRAAGWKGDEKRPIYGLDRLAKNPTAPVAVFEGEKTADAGAKLYPNVVCIAWQGGAQAINRVDWAPLKSRTTRVALWPDNDKPGRDAMLYLRALIPGAGLVDVPKTLPDGWDVADPLPAGVDLSLQGLLDRALDPTPPPAAPAAARPYVPLGTCEDGYVFVSRAEGYLLHLGTSDFTELNCYRLAPDGYWADLGLVGRSGIAWKDVARHLIDEARAVGPFNERHVRGRGVYVDAGRIVFHAGNILWVDGVRTDFSDFKSEYLYPKRPAITGYDLLNPLPVEESAKLAELVSLCSWARPRDAIFYVGSLWISLMPGAVDWRPHLYIQAEQGSGKTYIYTNIATRLLGAFANFLLGSSSTEAGTRQKMGFDSLATVFDEFDSESLGTKHAITGIQVLARQASSETGGVAVKGSRDGNAREFAIRSNFVFYSIANSIKMKADLSRTTVIELLKAPDSFTTVFPRLKALVEATTANADWVARFRGRAIRLVRETRQAISVFVTAVGSTVNDGRIADQYGALLGASWMVEYDTPPSLDQALGIVASSEIIEPTSASDEESDQVGCLNALCAFIVDFEDGGGRKTEPIGELLRRAFSPVVSPEVAALAERTLLRWGIKIADGNFIVANRHELLRKVFAATPYDDKWTTYLRRVHGASSSPKIHRFGTIVSRATSIPSTAILPPA